MHNYKYYLILFLTIAATIIFPSNPAFANDVSIPFTLSWDRNSESDLAYYRVYYGTSSRNYDNYITVDKQYPSCEFTPDILTVGQTYYITLTAIDFSLNESGYSEEIEIFVESSHPYTTTIPTTNITTTIPPVQKELCSTDDVLELRGKIPEEGTLSVTIADDPSYAISASLFVSIFDPDIPGEGYIYINENAPIDLPVDQIYNDLVHRFEVPINPDQLIQGENSFRFTHVDTQGYEIRELCVGILLTAPAATTTVYNPPSPTTTPVVTTITTTSSIPDEIPPTGAVIINNGDKIALSRLVILHLSAKDDTSTMDSKGDRIMFSNDNINWTTPEPFSQKRYWLLSPGEGVKTVFVKLRDSAGNWMVQPVIDTIKLEPSLACLKPIQLDIVGTASSGSFLPTLSKEKAVDGDTNTGWLTSISFFAQLDYITLDLGEIKIVNCINIYSNPLFFFTLFPLDFKIQISTDYTNWTDLFTVEDYSPPSSYSDTWVFDETKARYIKIVITKARLFLFFFYLSYIAEIEVNGCSESETENFQSTPSTTFEKTKPKVLKLSPDSDTTGEKAPLLNTLTPGQPGKPVFILNNNNH